MKKLSEWRVKMFELSLRAKDAKRGRHIWYSRDSKGNGLTYIRSKVENTAK